MNSKDVDFSSVFVKAYLIRTSIMHPVLEILGDPWNLSLLRSLSGQAQKFVSLTEQLQISRAALSSRLTHLQQHGCISTRQYCAAPPRMEYYLTPMGEALQPILLLLEQWNQRWLSAPAKAAAHSNSAQATPCCAQCKAPLKLLVVCRHCLQPLSLAQVKPLFFQALPEASPALQSYRRTRHNLAGKDSQVAAENINAQEWLRDRWSSLIIGAMLFGVRRFNDLQSILEIAPNILSGRLELLQQADLVSRHDDGYLLQPRGAGLYPAIAAMSGWGRQWLPAAQHSEQGWRMLHISCGNWAEHIYVCQACKAPCS
jgi:DNA-binding HxlR family transcriptional regulator